MPYPLLTARPWKGCERLRAPASEPAAWSRCHAGPEGYAAFVPAPLPPDPPLRFDARLQTLLDAANQALGRLDSVTTLLPDPALFLYAYVRKEAVLSSQIEGTQSSLSDLLLFEIEEAPGVPFDDVRGGVELRRPRWSTAWRGCAEAFRSRTASFARSTTMLLARGRGERASSPASSAGPRTGSAARGRATRTSYRRRPHVARGDDAALETFLHDEPEPDPDLLVKAALAHVQFETIHPFLDGNGRLGRLLITAPALRRRACSSSRCST